MKIPCISPQTNRPSLAFKRLEITDIHPDYIGKIPSTLNNLCTKNLPNWPRLILKPQEADATLATSVSNATIFTQTFSDLELDLYNLITKYKLLGENAKCTPQPDDIIVPTLLEKAKK